MLLMVEMTPAQNRKFQSFYPHPTPPHPHPHFTVSTSHTILSSHHIVQQAGNLESGDLLLVDLFSFYSRFT